MSLKIVGSEADEFSLGPTEEGTYEEANGGTEMMRRELFDRVDNDLLDQFQIICSRVRWIDPKKPTILWLHDTWDDPESEHLKEKEELALELMANEDGEDNQDSHYVPPAPKSNTLSSTMKLGGGDDVYTRM